MSLRPLNSLILFVSIVSLALVVLPAQKAYGASGEDGSLERIERQGALVVGYDIPYGVMEFYDDNGEPAGIDVDIVKHFADELGVKLDLKAMPFDDLFSAIQSRKVDIVASAVTITPDRQKTLLFSQPYLDAGMSLAVRADNSEITDHAGVAGKNVGVLKGTVGEDLAQKSDLFKSATIVPYKENEKRMSDLQQGNIDAAIVHFLVTDDQSIKLVGEPLKQSFYGIVTHLDNVELMNSLDKILRDMKRSGKLDSIRRKYAP